MLKITYFLILAFNLSIFAQTNYLMNLTNPNQIDSKSLEFDVVIKSVDTNFTLTSYQCSFSFDLNIVQDDSISLEYIENSSGLANSPINIIGYLQNDGIDELIFTSGIGNDVITTQEILVGKFKVTGTMDLVLEKLNLVWNFAGSVNTILTGDSFADITVPSNHKNFDYSITDIEKTDLIPHPFELSQNYPNPFNPSTKINFTLPEKGIVELTIYNIIGEKVIDVVKGTLNKGVHTVDFNGSNLASGTYIYRLNVEGKYVATKKMILLK